MRQGLLGLDEAKLKLEHAPLYGYVFRVTRKDEKVVRESKLVLIDDWSCASKGSPLTAAQAKMLFHLDMRVHEFKPSILASYVDGVVGD